MLRGVTCWCLWEKTQLPTMTYWVDHLRFRSKPNNAPQTSNNPNQFRERQSSHMRSREVALQACDEIGIRDGEVDMEPQNGAASRSKLVLSLGAATIVAVAMFAAEAKAQSSDEVLPNLESRVESLRPGVTETQVFADLAAHNEERKSALHDYTVMRTYQVVDLKGKVHAEESGRMEFFSPDKKTFTVTSES